MCCMYGLWIWGVHAAKPVSCMNPWDKELGTEMICATSHGGSWLLLIVVVLLLIVVVTIIMQIMAS